MGQKVNPIGFRTGIMIGWKSRWYASKQEFADLLVEDHKIRKYVRRRQVASFAGIPKIEIERTRDEVKVVLFAARPGVIIGRKGEQVEELQDELQNLVGPADQHQDRRNRRGRRLRPNWWPRTSPSSWRSGPASAAR